MCFEEFGFGVGESRRVLRGVGVGGSGGQGERGGERERFCEGFLREF